MENKISNAFKIFKMTLWLNFVTLKRYHANLVFMTVYAVVNGALMLLFVPLYSSSLSEIGTRNIVGFVLIGAAMLPLLEGSITSAADNASTIMWYGIINYIFTTPVSRYLYFLLESISSVILSFMIYLPIYIAAILFSLGSITFTGLLMSTLALFVALLAILQMGLLLSMAVLVFRSISGLEGIITLFVTFLSGAYIPLQVLPAAINSIAIFVPLTSSLYLVRYYLVGSSLIAPVGTMWVIVIGELLIFAFLAMVLFRVMEKKAAKIGYNYI